MAKTSGLGDNLYVSGYNLSGDVGSISAIAGGTKPLDVTGIDKSAHERIGGLRDGHIKFMAFFNVATGQAHPVLSALPTADAVLTYCQGTALGNPAAAMVAKQIGYDPKREASGAFTFDIEAQANGFGLGWGTQLTAGQRTDTTATSGTGVDLAASTTFGLQAYLHVFSFAGTSVTVKLQESADNASTDPYADTTGGAFTAATGVTSQRIATASGQTVKRWLRVVTTGTFTSAVFAVMVVKNVTAVTF